MASSGPTGPPWAVLSKDTKCPEDDNQRERHAQQPENEPFSHDGLSFSVWLSTGIKSLRVRAQLLQETGQVLGMLFFLRQDPF